MIDDISYTYTMTQGARSACARISVLKKDGSILRHEQQTMTEGSSSQTQEFYFEYTQNGNYQYTLQDDGLWLKTQTSVFPGEQTYFFVQLKDAFSDFAFNGENHTYHASDVTVTIADAYTYRCAAQVKFENKKLLSVRLDMQTETEETLVHLYEFNGTADVALPSEDQIVSPSSGMSESDWENALDEKIFENITCKFALIDGAWIKSKHTGSFAYDFCYFMCLKNMYETFKDCYDAQSETYIAKNIQVDIPADVSCESVTLSFAEKKLAFAAFVIADGAGSIECEIQYGKAIVSLPDDYTDET